MEVPGRVEEVFGPCYSGAPTLWAGGCPVPTLTLTGKWVNCGGGGQGLAGIATSFLENTVVSVEEPGELTSGADFPPNLLCDTGQFLQPL